MDGRDLRRLAWKALPIKSLPEAVPTHPRRTLHVRVLPDVARNSYKKGPWKEFVAMQGLDGHVSLTFDA